MCVIAGVLPIEVPAKERQSKNKQQRGRRTSEIQEVKIEDQQKSQQCWQCLWDLSTRKNGTVIPPDSSGTLVDKPNPDLDTPRQSVLPGVTPQDQV